VLAVAGWFVTLGVVAVLTRPRRIPSGPATAELGPEPPAVAHLLVSRWRVGEEAAEATLVDLAARGYLEFVQLGPDPRHTVCRLRPEPSSGEELGPYERRVLDRVRGRADDGMVPVSALAYGTSKQARAWQKRFRRSVVVDARQRGLSRLG
jgi:hypothetical protein